MDLHYPTVLSVKPKGLRITYCLIKLLKVAVMPCECGHRKLEDGHVHSIRFLIRVKKAKFLKYVFK